MGKYDDLFVEAPASSTGGKYADLFDQKPPKEDRVQHLLNTIQNPAYNKAGVAAAGANVVAGGINDLIGKLLSVGSKVIPEQIKKPVGKAIANTQVGFKLGTVGDVAQKAAQTYNQFEQTNPNTAEALNAVGNVASLYPGIKTPTAAITTAEKIIPKVVNKPFNAVIERLTHLDPTLLEKGSTKIGRAELKAATGSQAKLGDEIKQLLSDTRLPEHQQINEILPSLPTINLDDAITKLKSQKFTQPGSASESSANAAIEAQIKRWQKVKRMQGRDVPASQYKDLRESLDKDINWNSMSPTYNSDVNDALKSVRAYMADQLSTTAANAGNPEWKTLMKSWSSKIKTLDNVKKDMGKNPEGYIKTLFSGSKAGKQENLKALGELVGQDLLGQAENISLANKLPGGRFPWVPKHIGIEEAALGGGAYATHGANPLTSLIATGLGTMKSPALAARAYNPVTKTVGTAASLVARTAKTLPIQIPKVTIQSLIDSLNQGQQ